MSDVIRLRHYGGPGVHGYDPDGELWSTWGVVRTGGGPVSPVPCALCGAPITSGYISGYRTGRQRVCLSHVEWEYESEGAA